MAMSARMKRLYSDYDQVRRDFAGHKNILVTPVGDEPPEKYHVTYFVNGIYLLADGSVETLGRHEVDIILHADYPRYKPICKITTPIWHPNFRDGQICIGDIWGAGESLSDIIVNIGDMIQYKSWNSYSPLCAEAAQWAMENKHLFPVGNVDLYYADYDYAKEQSEIDLYDDFAGAEGQNDESAAPPEAAPPEAQTAEAEPVQAETPAEGEPAAEDGTDTAGVSGSLSTAEKIEPEPQNEGGDDIVITPEELQGIEFIPAAQRMQTLSHATVKGGRINFKTILQKGLMWALIGALVGFVFTELIDPLINEASVARMMGYPYLAEYYREYQLAEDTYSEEYSSESSRHYSNAMSALENSYIYEFGSDQDRTVSTMDTVLTVQTGIWAALLAMFIGLFLGIGEGVFYGSRDKALKYAGIGAGVSIVIGFVSGYLAQLMYGSVLGSDPSTFAASFIRGLGWAIMGVGIGAAVGLIKPEKRRVLFCCVGGLAGAFIGGFLFNFVFMLIPNEIVARGVAIIIMGLLIGVGVGLLEQFAKQAWLKVIRGEFEGKEYLVFAGTTSIGNNGKNTIVLFKDKLVGPHHCDIIMEGNKYVLVDCGTPMGTIVNGMRTTKHVLRHGDAISIGNSVLLFNTK